MLYCESVAYPKDTNTLHEDLPALRRPFVRIDLKRKALDVDLDLAAPQAWIFYDKIEI